MHPEVQTEAAESGLCHLGILYAERMHESGRRTYKHLGTGPLALFAAGGTALRGTKTAPRPAREPTQTISFRVDARMYRRLEEAAEKVHMSPGEYARKMVGDSLDDHVHARLLEEAVETHQAVSRLRSDLATALETLLLNLTTADRDEIRQWVSEQLRR